MTRPTWVGAFTASETSAAWPAGHQADDYALVGIECATETPVTPPGFTLLPDFPVVSGIGTKLFVYERWAVNGSEGPATGPGVAVNHAWIFGGVWRNVHRTKPIHALSALFHENALTTVTFPSARIHHDDTKVVHFASWVLDSAADIVSAETNAALTSVTKRYAGGTITGNGGGGGIIDADGPDAGANGIDSGRTTCTVTSTGYTCATIVLNPIADKVIANVALTDGDPGDPVADGETIRAFDITQPAASGLCTVDTTSGGTGAFSILAPYDDHDYQVVRELGGASVVEQAV